MDPLSPEPSELQTLSSQLNLDRDTAAAALSLYRENANYCPAQGANAKSYVRCAILLACKTTKVRTLAGDSVPANYVSVTQLLRSPSAPRLQEFVPELLSFAERVSVEDCVKADVQALTHRYAFAMKFFEKFEDLWNALKVENECAETLQEVSWLLFLVVRQRLLPASTDVVETTNLLLAVVDLARRQLPAAQQSLDSLCSLVKTKAAVVLPMLARAEALVAQLHTQELLRPLDPREMLAGAHVHYNLQALNRLYAESLPDIDERDFIANCHKVGTPIKQGRVLTPFARQSGRLPSQRVIQWDDEVETDWQDFSAKTAISAVATPVTLSMEMNNWLHEMVELVHMQGVLPSELCAALGDREPAAQAAVHRLGSAMAKRFAEAGVGTVTTQDQSFIEKHFSDLRGALPLMSPEYLFSNSKVDLVLRLSGVMIQRMPQCDLATLRGVAACSTETVFFLHNITALDFEAVVQLCECSVVELWAVLVAFMEADARMPLPLKQHLRHIEAKVISVLAWTDATVLSQLRTPQLEPFLQRVLSHSAQRAGNLCDCLHLTEDTKSAVFSTLAHILQECPELLRDRHLDQILLCCVYACCKMRAQVSFKRINEVYARLNPEEVRSLTQRVAIKAGQFDNIIVFYNKVFLPKTKTHITGEASPHSLGSTSPITYQLPQPVFRTLAVPALHPRSPLTSPILTPRTRLLYAHKETPVKTEDPAKNHHRVLAYDDEERPTLPAHLRHILSPASSLPFELPQLKPDDRSNPLIMKTIEESRAPGLGLWDLPAEPQSPESHPLPGSREYWMETVFRDAPAKPQNLSVSFKRPLPPQLPRSQAYSAELDNVAQQWDIPVLPNSHLQPREQPRNLRKRSNQTDYQAELTRCRTEHRTSRTHEEYYWVNEFGDAVCPSFQGVRVWRKGVQHCSPWEVASQYDKVQPPKSWGPPPSATRFPDENLVATGSSSHFQSPVKWQNIGLPQEFLEVLRRAGCKSPSKVQAEGLRFLLENDSGHLVAQSPTGSGKTLAFVLGTLTAIDRRNPEVQVICVAPTNELIDQLCSVYREYAQSIGVRVGIVHTTWKVQQVLLMTPHQLAFHLPREQLPALQFIVLDEADHILEDLKFTPAHVRDAVQRFPKCRMLLFSATFSEEVLCAVDEAVGTYERIAVRNDDLVLDNIRLYYVRTFPGESKLNALERVLRLTGGGVTIIFVNSSKQAQQLVQVLTRRGLSAALMAGQVMTMQERRRTIEQFHRGLYEILVATNVLARGIDDTRVYRVINFDIPLHWTTSLVDCEAFLHRVGRAGRFARAADAITLVTSETELSLLEDIMMQWGCVIQEL